MIVTNISIANSNITSIIITNIIIIIPFLASNCNIEKHTKKTTGWLEAINLQLKKDVDPHLSRTGCRPTTTTSTSGGQTATVGAKVPPKTSAVEYHYEVSDKI